MELTTDQVKDLNAAVNAAMILIKEQLDHWIGLVTRAMRDVRNNPVLTRKEVTEGLREMARTRQMLLNERDRHLEAYKQEVDIVHDRFIDFETERIAIASKLDRLRSAGEAESVSG